MTNELTVEEKAERYDKIIEAAKRLCDDVDRRGVTAAAKILAYHNGHKLKEIQLAVESDEWDMINGAPLFDEFPLDSPESGRDE